MDRLKSRKLWLAVAGVVGAILMGVSGAISPDQAIKSAAGVIMVYLAAQGWVDSKMY
jgi:hypothetical protein